MPKPKNIQHLPDAMPDVERPTLLVVCDSHQCLLIDVGRHTLLLHDVIHSKEETFTDHEGRLRSPAAFGKGGLTASTVDWNLLERNRMREFAHVILEYVAHAVDRRGIEEWYLSAPAKLLSILRKDLSVRLQRTLKGVREGIFTKEPPRKILLRFRPDLEEAMRLLREEENYSPRKRPPKRARRR